MCVCMFQEVTRSLGEGFRNRKIRLERVKRDWANHTDKAREAGAAILM